MQIPLAFKLSSVELATLGMIASNQIGIDIFLALPWLKIGNL